MRRVESAFGGYPQTSFFVPPKGSPSAGRLYVPVDEATGVAGMEEAVTEKGITPVCRAVAWEPPSCGPPNVTLPLPLAGTTNRPSSCAYLTMESAISLVGLLLVVFYWWESVYLSACVRQSVGVPQSQK